MYLIEGEVSYCWFQILYAITGYLPIHSDCAHKVSCALDGQGSILAFQNQELHRNGRREECGTWNGRMEECGTRNKECGTRNGMMKECGNEGRTPAYLTSRLLSANENTPLMSSFLRIVTFADVGDSICAPPRPDTSVTWNTYNRFGMGKR